MMIKSLEKDISLININFIYQKDKICINIDNYLFNIPAFSFVS